jgi:hypothetical protein
MAVDYTRVNAARTAFQVALDSTALMMSKDAATLTDEQRETEARKPSARCSTGLKSPTHDLQHDRQPTKLRVAQ